MSVKSAVKHESGRSLRKTYNDGFKVKVVLEALRETQPLSELASKYEVHPNQNRQRKAAFLDKAPEIFSGKTSEHQEIERLRRRNEELTHQIGELAIDNTKTFNNACATRVSIALIKANMRVKKDFLVQVGKHAGQGFIASAKGLQEWLSQENVWNTADVTVDKTDKDTFPGKTNLEIIREKLNGKKGVYIILGGFQKGITGHATLWTGTDVIGGKDDDVEDNTYSSHIDNGATVYFWELKESSSTRGTYVEDDQIKEMYWSYGEGHTKLEKHIGNKEDNIWEAKYYGDLNLHIVTEDGNDGKNVVVIIRNDGDDTPLSNETDKIVLNGTIHGSNVLFENVFKVKNMPYMRAVAICGSHSMRVIVMRPSWGDVYGSHPVHNKETFYTEELKLENGKWSTQRIFASIFSGNYNANANTYGGKDAGATRLSIALIESGVKMRREFLTTASDLAKRRFIASVRDLHAWLSKPNVWGDADITISGGSTLAKVNQEIGKKNGVYIILNGNQKDDVAALWQYAKGDVIEGRNNIDKGGTVYFWELKGEAGNRNSFVGNVLHLILPNAPKRFVSDFITVAGEKIFVDYDKQDFFKDKIEGPVVYRKEQVNVHISLIDMPILSNIDFAKKSQLSTIKERYKDRPDVYKKLASGESHYIFMPKKHYSKRYEDFAFAYYHELAHILHPEGGPPMESTDDENIRSEYVADETAIAKLGWGADEYREYIREAFGRNWLDNKNVDEEPSPKRHRYARRRLLKSLEYDEKKQVGR